MPKIYIKMVWTSYFDNPGATNIVYPFLNDLLLTGDIFSLI